jgi:hypothetical protein
MRTIDFETILAQSLQMCGLDRENISVETFNQFRDFANHRIRFGFEFDIWPQLLRTTKMPIVHQSDVHYIVIPDDGIVTNNEGTFKIDIGDVMQITIEDPRTTGKVTELSFTFDEYDSHVGNNVFNTVQRLIVSDKDSQFAYVTYRIKCPELIGDIWSSGTYYPGQQVYWAYSSGKYFAPTTGPSYSGKKGNFWKCISESTTSPNVNNNNAPASSDKWEKIKIPAFLGNFIIKGCHADWLRSEMQIEYAQAIEKEALAVLDFEVGKAIIQQGVQPRLKFNQIY